MSINSYVVYTSEKFILKVLNLRDVNNICIGCADYNRSLELEYLFCSIVKFCLQLIPRQKVFLVVL